MNYLYQTFGSVTNPYPLSDDGGSSPVRAYFSASTIVVLPDPFAPQKIVRGRKNTSPRVPFVIGEKLRIPQS